MNNRRRSSYSYDQCQHSLWKKFVQVFNRASNQRRKSTAHLLPANETVSNCLSIKHIGRLTENSRSTSSDCDPYVRPTIVKISGWCCFAQEKYFILQCFFFDEL